MAKMLAAAGCDVTITHARGRNDAAAVAEDIRNLGAGRCDTAALDLSRPFESPSTLRAQDVDAVFYFATPRIHAKRSRVFHREAFDEFTGFYLERFQEVCLWLEGGGRPARVYLPSTAFVTERPKGMTEYAMAKAAAELLADDLNRTLRHVRIVHTRLPRLATDQTASITPLTTADSVSVLLEVMQAMRA
jgi:NAD(P)-dependent dehydrogenase (short-subunit alcohol dehydrogenase family)